MKRAIPPLTDQQRADILRFLSAGGDLESVCNYARATPVQLRLEMKRDPEFAKEVARAEAGVELGQMGNVMKASRDEKNWRTSVWWIERRTRLRKAAEDRTFSESDLFELVDALSQVIVQEIADAEVQQRVIEKLLDAVTREPREAPRSDRPQPLPLAPPDAPRADEVQTPPTTE